MHFLLLVSLRSVVVADHHFEQNVPDACGVDLNCKVDVFVVVAVVGRHRFLPLQS